MRVGKRDFESIHDGPLKLIRRRNAWGLFHSPYQFFELSADPGERMNLGSLYLPSAEERRLRARLRALNKAIARRAGPGRKVAVGELDDKTKSQLKALGYLQ
ncbi:MAG: hypothetical protein ACREQQ_01025 [Candidatus Binatia bacterium]